MPPSGITFAQCSLSMNPPLRPSARLISRAANCPPWSLPPPLARLARRFPPDGRYWRCVAMDTQAFWHFRCPECGFGDTEHGHLLTAHEIYCLICQEEDRRQVRLHRWEATEVKEPAD